MSAPPPVPSPETIVAQHRVMAERRRFAWRLMWGVLLGLLLLVLLLPAALYFAWQARGRALLREQLEIITVAGEPITTGEMAEWYAVPPGARDITEIWVAALAPFEDRNFQASSNHLPLLGQGEKLPPLDEPIPEEHRQAIETWLAEHRDKVDALYAAARVEGEVRFSRDWNAGLAMLLREAQDMRSASRVLQLEWELLARADDLEPALENLRARMRMAETLRHEPILISLLVRIAIQSVVLDDLRRLAATDRLTDEQLAALQALVRQFDSHAQLPETMIGERATCYHAFHLVRLFNVDPDRAFDGADGQGSLETTHDIAGVSRPEDCAAALKYLTTIRAAAELPLPQALDAADQADQQLRDLLADRSILTRLRYMMTMMLSPATNAVFQADARAVALRDLTDTSLAVRRYRLKHGQPPEKLADLIPDFLPAVPIDPFDGQPLRYRVTDDHVLLYSIGRDRADDGGATDEQGLEPDIVVEVRWGASQESDHEP
jgi:hypothetical protein